MSYTSTLLLLLHLIYLSYLSNVYRACSFFANSELFCMNNARVIYWKIWYLHNIHVGWRTSAYQQMKGVRDPLGCIPVYVTHLPLFALSLESYQKTAAMLKLNVLCSIRFHANWWMVELRDTEMHREWWSHKPNFLS
jgi:hypothetical protein